MDRVPYVCSIFHYGVYYCEIPLKKIFVTPDLTHLEQRNNKVLRQQLRELNKEEKIYRIKNREIV